jgi:hypothetical protein
MKEGVFEWEEQWGQMLKVAKVPRVGVEEPTILCHGIHKNIVKWRPPNVIVVIELAELWCQPYHSRLHDAFLLIFVSLVRGDKRAQVAFCHLVRGMEHVALAPLNHHFKVVALFLGSHPGAVDSKTGNKRHERSAGKPALAVHRVYGDGGVATRQRTLLADDSTAEPRVENATVIFHRVPYQTLRCLAKHRVLILAKLQNHGIKIKKECWNASECSKNWGGKWGII